MSSGSLYSEIQVKQVWTCLRGDGALYKGGAEVLYRGGRDQIPVQRNAAAAVLYGGTPCGQNDWWTRETENITLVTQLAGCKNVSPITYGSSQTTTVSFVIKGFRAEVSGWSPKSCIIATNHHDHVLN